MDAQTTALVHIMETFLVRERVSFRKRVSKTSNSVYFDIRGPRFPYRLRVSDHDESMAKDFQQTSDFHVLSPADIRAAQTSIEARVIRPLRSLLKAR
jgi:hypothetical protein